MEGSFKRISASVKQSENTAQEWERCRNVRSFFNPARLSLSKYGPSPQNSCRERTVELNRPHLLAAGKPGASPDEPLGAATFRHADQGTPMSTQNPTKSCVTF